MNKNLFSSRIFYLKDIDLPVVTPANNGHPFLSVHCLLDILSDHWNSEMSYWSSSRHGVNIKSVSHIVYQDIAGRWTNCYITTVSGCQLGHSNKPFHIHR